MVTCLFFLPSNIRVSQGSVLGPLLLLLSINDLPTAAQHSFINLFADDTSMYSGNGDMENLQVLLQNDITTISRWFYENKLSVSAKKMCVVEVGSRHKVNTSCDF